MTEPLATSADSEIERQHLLQQFAADNEIACLGQFKPGTAGCHELLDRTNLVADLVEKYLLGHPACLQNPEWYHLAEQSLACLRNLYQGIGELHLEEPSDLKNGAVKPAIEPRPAVDSMFRDRPSRAITILEEE